MPPPLLLPHRYLLALGSNLGDRLAVLHQAGAAIAAELGPVSAHAPFYVTEPLGAADQPFINSALIVATSLLPNELLPVLLAIEHRLGRVRRERWGNRVIDLDILLWQQHVGGAWHSQTCSSPSLQVPHPHLLERDFALVPAAAIAGEWLHPLRARTLQDELNQRAFTLKPL